MSTLKLYREIKAAGILGEVVPDSSYFTDLKRIAHCGFIEKVKGSWLYTIEANTNLPGSRNGDGVYRRMRHSRTIQSYADWFQANPKKKGVQL